MHEPAVVHGNGVRTVLHRTTNSLRTSRPRRARKIIIARPRRHRHEQTKTDSSSHHDTAGTRHVFADGGLIKTCLHRNTNNTHASDSVLDNNND
jgi:hypothetical protein